MFRLLILFCGPVPWTIQIACMIDHCWDHFCIRTTRSLPSETLDWLAGTVVHMMLQEAILRELHHVLLPQTCKIHIFYENGNRTGCQVDCTIWVCKKKRKNNQFLKNHRKIQRSCVQKMATGTEAHVTAHFHLPRPGEWEAVIMPRTPPAIYKCIFPLKGWKCCPEQHCSKLLK